MSGVPVIVRTRVPVSAIFGIIEGGAMMEEIVERFPGISEEKIREVPRFTATNAAA